MSERSAAVLVCVFLAGVTLAVFGQVYKNEFINLDDPGYVTRNEYVQSGLTRDSIIWAFTTGQASNWHPLTWLSLMLDYQLFGLNAGGFHITNLLFHIANALLLFLVLKKMTGAFWRSGFVALAFALHPLHVESVAWAAERKDVLSTLFWLLTMAAYLEYVRRPGVFRYLLVFLVFALGLMAKPMLVTLPFVLLVLDYWPLGRLRFSERDRNEANKRQAQSALVRLVVEKIPLFVLSGISSIITIIAQQRGGAVIAIRALNVGWRISNVFISYAVYILKMIVPVKLAVFYPGMTPPGLPKTIGAAVLVICITILVIFGARRWKYLATGWLWYVGTLVPVIGIVQVGAQAYADRYTYVPLTGLFIIVAWGAADLLGGWRYKRTALILCACVVGAAMAIVTTLQVGRWRSTITLFEHAVAVTEENCVAHNALGNAYGLMGQLDKSIKHSEEALRIFPEFDSGHYNLGMGYYNTGRVEEAIEQWEETLRLTPDFKDASFNIGIALEVLGRGAEAVEYFRRELAVNPGHKRARERLSALEAEHPGLRRR